MAANTPLAYRNLVIYEVFVRNHGPRGSFCDVEDDLPRLRELGVDVLWLMPIYPIGELYRKGAMGSPYSIRDYREINPEYGTKDDFLRLLRRAHDLGLKVMLDIVFNHMSFDSSLIQQHIDWFHRGADGGPFRAPSGWTDIVGLKHPNESLSRYLIETLCYWSSIGVDGFRCDVASLLPLDFWQEARCAVDKLNPDTIWFAESVSATFIALRRAENLTALTHSELFQIFDIVDDYDIWPLWRAAVAGQVPVGRYLEMLRFQDSCYPENFVKLRYVENHDLVRLMSFVSSPAQALAWTAFEAFNKGAMLIYAGQEAAVNNTPSLFERDPINWGYYPLQGFFSALSQIKKDLAQRYGQFFILAAEPAIQAIWRYQGANLFGIFNVNAVNGKVIVPLADGDGYVDLIEGNRVQVQQGQMPVPPRAIVLRFSDDISVTPLYSELLDYDFGLT